MKKLLVVFVKEFPYYLSEPFLETEYPLYKEYFDKVLIVTNRPTSACIRGEKTREVNDPAVEILENSFNCDFRHKLGFVLAALSDPKTYSEFFNILFHHKVNLTAMRNMFTSIAKGNLCIKIARKRTLELEKEGYKVVAAYAYWLIYPAYSAVKFSEKYYDGKLFTISRAHGFDLYESRNAGNYIPLRKYILTGLSEIASISDDGKRYLEQKYPDYQMNITVRHLGAKDVGIVKEVKKENVLRIVSCARTVSVKRIDRIVDALREITDINIVWTHCGGGKLLNKIKQKAMTLPQNITCIFTGTIPNTEVYELYKKNDYHLFLNVSKSEGVPVSIMEAMSFGLPVIATAVGGVPELVDAGKNGFLLDRDYMDEELIEYIRDFYIMEQDRYNEMRWAARDKFEREYNAVPNYRKFIEEILEKSGK